MAAYYGEPILKQRESCFDTVTAARLVYLHQETESGPFESLVGTKISFNVLADLDKWAGIKVGEELVGGNI